MWWPLSQRMVLSGWTVPAAPSAIQMTRVPGARASTNSWMFCFDLRIGMRPTSLPAVLATGGYVRRRTEGGGWPVPGYPSPHPPVLWESSDGILWAKNLSLGSHIGVNRVVTAGYTDWARGYEA